MVGAADVVVGAAVVVVSPVVEVVDAADGSPSPLEQEARRVEASTATAAPRHDRAEINRRRATIPRLPAARGYPDATRRYSGPVRDSRYSSPAASSPKEVTCSALTPRGVAASDLPSPVGRSAVSLPWQWSMNR